VDFPPLADKLDFSVRLHLIPQLAEANVDFSPLADKRDYVHRTKRVEGAATINFRTTIRKLN